MIPCKRLTGRKSTGPRAPIYVEDAEPGDTLAVEIIGITVPDKGVIVTVPKQGILAEKSIVPSTRMVRISKSHGDFLGIKLSINPMIGTIGVTPAESEIPCGSLGRHGRNMDVKEITSRSKLFFPVFAKGVLFAAGDLHAVQADGELCVSAIEVPGEILVKFEIIKNKKPEWPVLGTKDSYSLLACGRRSMKLPNWQLKRRSMP